MKTISEYVQTLARAEIADANMVRVVPTNFIGTGPGVYFDNPRSWHTGQKILSETKVATAVFCTPIFWQMEIIAHDVVRDAKIVPCYMSPGNTPLARVATQSLSKLAVIIAGFGKDCVATRASGMFPGDI